MKELNYKDQLYVDSMKQFRLDIEAMIMLMRRQFTDIRKQMLVHLDKVEEQFIQDRDKLIADYKGNIDNLIRNLNMEEANGARNLTNLEDEKEAAAEREAYKQEMDFINKVIVMETHFNFLKETTENFSYELKIMLERLDYRVEVRDEKIRENQEKKNQYEKANSKLHDKIQENLTIYQQKDLDNRIKNSQLKEELMKMTHSYDELKEKFQHFEKYDDLRFKDIYNMKSKEALDLAMKVALADRTIRTQQLGMEILNNDNKDGFSLEELQNSPMLDANNKEGIGGNENVENKNLKLDVLSRIPTERVKQVFSYIIQSAEFLIDLEVNNLYNIFIYNIDFTKM
jgi:dynein regulatory complex protein 1